MAIGTIIVRGFGSFGGVNFLPTKGYTPGVKAITSDAFYRPASTDAGDTRYKSVDAGDTRFARNDEQVQ